MRITNHQAYQAHPVPKHVYYAEGEDLPLDYEILQEPEQVFEEDDDNFDDYEDED
jgi:hypothetical protein